MEALSRVYDSRSTEIAGLPDSGAEVVVFYQCAYPRSIPSAVSKKQPTKEFDSAGTKTDTLILALAKFDL